MKRQTLPPPRTIVEEPVSSPSGGWFRRLERAINQRLNLHVYPLVPGLARPYSRQLRRSLVLSECEVSVPGLHRDLGGVSVLLVTDVHAGALLDPAALARSFDALSTLAPDLILLGGDHVTCHDREFDPLVPLYRRLEAPLGVFAVLGNHDYYGGDVARLVRSIEGAGVPVLRNTSVTIERGSARLTLAGIDDLVLGEPDLDRALSVSDEAPLLLLSHNPDVVFEAARRGVRLVLSGHTHGGQVRVPGMGVLVRRSRYALDEGRFLAGECELVVSRGIGVAGLPFRIGCPPEALMIRLYGEARERSETR